MVHLQWWSERRLEFIEGIHERIGLRPIDPDDTVKPGRHRNWFDYNRNQPALSVAHVEHLGDDRFLFCVAALQVSWRNHRHRKTALADGPLHFLKKAGVGGKIPLVD